MRPERNREPENDADPNKTKSTITLSNHENDAVGADGDHGHDKEGIQRRHGIHPTKEEESRGSGEAGERLWSGIKGTRERICNGLKRLFG